MGYADPQKQRDYCKGHYAKNKASYLARNARQRREIRQYMQRAKSEPCADCQRSFPYYVMDFDHRPGTEKLYEPTRLLFVGSLKTVITELEKCDLVCANCHRIRTHDRALEQKRSKNLARTVAA
jgi:NAD-dependent dihydropyrimidine dehydrogenase PreA subunit